MSLMEEVLKVSLQTLEYCFKKPNTKSKMKKLRKYYVKSPPITTRKEWGAKFYVKGLYPLIHPVQNVIVDFYESSSKSKCLASDSCLEHLREIQKQDIELEKLADIAHNFVIGASMTIYEGRGWDVASDKFLRKVNLLQNKIDILVLTRCLENKPLSDIMNLVTRLVRYGVFKEIIEKRHRVYIHTSDDYRLTRTVPDETWGTPD